jgi:hypothetical protein
MAHGTSAHGTCEFAAAFVARRRSHAPDLGARLGKFALPLRAGGLDRAMRPLELLETQLLQLQ